MTTNRILLCVFLPSPQPMIPPGREEIFKAGRWLLSEKLLKKPRYAKLGLGNDEINSIAAQAVAEPLPSGMEDRMRELEKRLRTALDDKALALAIAQRPVRLGPVAIQRLPPRLVRKALGYDHKPNKSGEPILFSQLNFDTEEYPTVEDYVGHEFFELQQKGGFEGEQARQRREERDAVIGDAAEKINLAPVLAASAKTCTRCGEAISDDAKRFMILRAELPRVGLEVTAIEPLAVLCEKCRSTAQIDVPAENAKDAEDESWMESLTSNEREALRLKDQGLNQSEIGKKMGKCQSTISRILVQVERKRDSGRVKKLRLTGGA